jgi:hypothetical protein
MVRLYQSQMMDRYEASGGMGLGKETEKLG